MTTFTYQMAQFATSGAAAHADADTKAILRLSLLDWAACALAGAQEPVSQRIRTLIASEGGAAQAYVFGGPNAPMRAAALANGTISHALDYDDTHFLHIGHPAVVIFSASLAVAEVQGASGAAFLEAALTGYEASCRIGDWLGRKHYEAGFHQTATAGAFGAAIAASVLMGHDTDQVANSIGLTATRASGLKAQFGTDGKPFNAGIAASNGVEAAMLTDLGFVSNPDALEAAQGFAATHLAERKSPQDVLAGVGETWISRKVQHKLHACCHGLHASLEALAQLRDRLPRDQIDRITIHTHPRWLDVCNQPAPSTGLETKFSYRMTAAMALAGVDTARRDSFADTLCTRGDLVALRDRVDVVPDASLTDMQARVAVALADGTVHTARHDLDAPQTVKHRVHAVRRKAVSLLGAAKEAEVWHAVEALPAAKSVQAFVSTLAMP